MKKNILLLAVLFFQISSLQGQNANIIKGTNELREIIFKNYLVNLKQIEYVRQKLDSIDVTTNEFRHFCFNLRYVSKNLDNDESQMTRYRIEYLKQHRIYNYLSNKEIAILIDNFILLNVPLNGIWDKRYPHSIDRNSVRSKEISNYGVKKGDKILHFNAYNNHLCDVLFLSHDSIETVHHPRSFSMKERDMFDLVSNSVDHTHNKLKYPLTETSELDLDEEYDIIVYDAIGILSYSRYPSLKSEFKQIKRMLKDDGILIIGCNYFYPPFDGPFKEMDEIEKSIKKVLKAGFKIEDKIHSDNEFLIYKFSKL